MSTKLVSFILTTLTLTQVLANHVKTTPTIGNIAFAGTGCPAGSARIEFVPGRDRNNLTFLFDNYSVSTDGRQIARASCNMAIPIQVPKGYALVLPQITLDGLAQLQIDDEAKLQTEVFFAGSQGTIEKLVFDSADDGIFSFAANGPVRLQAPCGVSVNLRLNSSVSLVGNYNSGSYVTIEKMKFQLPLKLVTCRK